MLTLGASQRQAREMKLSDFKDIYSTLAFWASRILPSGPRKRACQKVVTTNMQLNDSELKLAGGSQK